MEILHDLYFEWRDGYEYLEPVAKYYINGLDELPGLKVKNLWNEDKFNESRKPFTDSYPELHAIVLGILQKENAP
ncbi:hypothetical protein K6119_11205 [Paracrocinitomix mangrovi]|uniref:hypothetical protein n=1 Tax=Paracrocinitomix mangrovi TaxID=2862509 RepID=UPI001EDB9611|nr:hypothetical protein [Paracrocinitomix mangrovi]UKN00301.1 hypothetical protein K6119_11205 [Paracrocinitomix mangrovi]